MEPTIDLNFPPTDEPEPANPWYCSLKESANFLREIVGGECRGPFEKHLTQTEVEENLLIVTESEYEEFILPFLKEDDQEHVNGDGIPVIMYGNQEDFKEMNMTLTTKESDDDSQGMYTLIGCEDFCKNHKSLIKVDAFVKIWMFRHAQNQKLCSAIIPGRLELGSGSSSHVPTSQTIIQENQDPPSQYLDIIGEWSGPFSKKLSISEVKQTELSINKEHSKVFIEPLLANHDCDLKRGVPVTMYINNTSDGKKKFLVKLKVRESGRYVIIGRRKDFFQTHESIIKVDEFVTLWMFRHKKSKQLGSIITPGRVVEEEKYILPRFPPVASLTSLIDECSKPFVKKFTATDANPSKDFLLFGKKYFCPFLEDYLHEEEKETDSIPVTVYDADGKDFSMRFKKWRFDYERALNRGWSAFCKTRKPNKDEEFAIWMFHNNRGQKLCFAIIPFNLITTAEAE